MKLTITTTEGIKEYENILEVSEDFTKNKGVYSLTPFLPTFSNIDVDMDKVLFIRIDKEDEKS